MTRRGLCHCGCILHFQHGPHGFKVRCPQCGSVVRLQPKGLRKKTVSLVVPHLPINNGDTPMLIASSSETFSMLSTAPEPLQLRPEINAAPNPAVFEELVPAVSAPTPLPANFWTPRLLLIMLTLVVAALAFGMLIFWFVWMA